MSEAPLTIALAARKPRTLVGEGIILDLRIAVRANLEMETVELNRGRTEVLVSAAGGGEFGNRVLTGEDYRVLHRHPPLEPVGTAFVAPAGSAWKVELELLRYARPLPAGSYRVELAYRFGPGDEDVVHSNAVAVEVAPAQLRSVEDRWLGGSDARDRLASLVRAEGPDGVRWIHQTARSWDPGVIETAADLEMPAVAALTPPRLAHLNDIAALHFERFALWREASGMGWVKVHAYGRSGAPGVVALQLDGKPAPRAVEPALQSRADVLQALWVGEAKGKPAVTWVELDKQGQAKQRTIALPGRMPLLAVAAWGRGEEPVGVTLFLAEPADRGAVLLRSVRLPGGEQRILQQTEAELAGLEIDQWMGFAGLHLLTRVREKHPQTGEPLERLQIARWDIDDGKVTPGAGWSVPLAEPVKDELAEHLLSYREFRQAVSLPGGSGVVLLFQKRDGWIVWSADERVRITPPAPAAGERPVHLVSTPEQGVDFVFHEPERGFSALPVSERRR